MLRIWAPIAIVAGSLLLGAAGGAAADRRDRNYDNGYQAYRYDRSGWYDRNDGRYRYDSYDRDHRYDRDDRNWRRREELAEERAAERRAAERRWEERHERDRRDRFHGRWHDRDDYR